MRKISPLGRESKFWQEAFVTAYAELLHRAPPSDKVLPGARIAQLACSMADDCEAARSDVGGACELCRGVGCEACKFTGKANAAEGLHAPAPAVERALSLVGPPPPAEGDAPAPTSLDALSRSIEQADRDTQVKRRERFGGGPTDPES